jgi:hypothetical protein
MRGRYFSQTRNPIPTLDSETDPDFDSDVEADYGDFMFEFQVCILHIHRGGHHTMKENRPATPGPVDESDDEEVDTTVANTSEPWQTDMAMHYPCL